jgi:RNA polymerase sigma factor (sigma-70 family)
MTPLLTSALLRTQSDEHLVLLVRDGQERAFDAIVDRYRKPLQRYCERVLPRSRAEDVVQQALTKAWCALQEGTEVRALRPWLYRIAATTVLETARAPGYDYDELKRSLTACGEPETELEQQVIIRKTLAGLAALPDAQREALLRDAFEGQSRAQIADALGVSEGAVRQLLHRARATLRTAATAITPLPLVSWLAATGPAPAAGTALEGGAAGTIGLAGVAKGSTIVATAGVVVSGSAAVQHHRARHAPVEHAKHALVRQHRAEAGVSRAVPVNRRVTPQKVQQRGGAEGVSESERTKGGSNEADGRDEHESQQRSERSEPAESQRDEQPHETHGGDGGDGGDEGDSGQSSSDSGDSGD